MTFLLLDQPMEIILLSHNQEFKIEHRHKFKSLKEASDFYEGQNFSILEFLKNFNCTEIVADKIYSTYLKDSDIKYVDDILLMRQARKFVKGDIQDFLGFSHYFSREKISETVAREDNMAIQAIEMLSVLNKDIQHYSFRLKELYGWYFPELERLKSTEDYIVCVKKFNKIRSKNEEEIKKLAEETNVSYETIINSIGNDLTEFDWENIKNLTNILNGKVKNKLKLQIYIENKVKSFAPNLAKFLGGIQSARFFALAGSFKNLAKYPSSTIQMLGAEKSLFNALKKKTRTPKYGYIYQTDLITETEKKYRGRMARSVASKISLLARIDLYSSTRTNKFGKVLKKHMVDIRKAYKSGERVAFTSDILSNIKL